MMKYCMYSYIATGSVESGSGSGSPPSYFIPFASGLSGPFRVDSFVGPVYLPQAFSFFGTELYVR